MIFGDFNIDTLKESAEKKQYENLLAAYDFEIQNTLPTRVTPYSRSCLDHMITSSFLKTNTIPTTISDHYTVTADILLRGSSVLPQNLTAVTKYRNLREIKGEKALNFLFLLLNKLQRIPDEIDINHKVELLAKTIMECIEKFAPEKNIAQNKRPTEWITNQIKRAITKRDKLFQKWINDPNETNRSAYRKQRNEVTQKIRAAKRDANLKRLGHQPTPKTIYNTLKQQKRQERSIPQTPSSEILNNYFTSIGPALSSEIPIQKRKCKIERIKRTMVLSHTNEDEVSKVLRKLKNKKSAGHDGISNEILKCCSPIVEPFLVDIFNKSIDQGVFPSSLKLTKVIPLYKKGDYSNPENYRPISLLSSLSKVYEHLLFERMVVFCKKNEILSSKQFGFREKMSCINAIISVTEYMRDEIDKKSTGQACFIDLKKAFDTLDHSILLDKIEKYGFRGKVLQILESYLHGRRQYTIINGMESQVNLLSTGVPQGSVLGPLLFLIYINDIEKCVENSQLAMFADDTTVIKAGKRVDNLIRKDVDCMFKWFCSNKLTVNIDKCESICFGLGKPEKVEIDGQQVEYKNACKYLGVYIDKNLKFRDHIDYVVKKLNIFCGLIYRVRHLYPKNCLLLFYNSFAKSIIMYGILVYGSAAKTNLVKIEKAQRRILRAIFFMQRTDSLSEIFTKEGVLTVFELFLVELIKELFKQIRLESPSQLLNLGSMPENIHLTRFRRKQLLPSIYCRTTLKRKSLTNSLRIAHNWLMELKLIPMNLKDLPAITVKNYIGH